MYFGLTYDGGDGKLVLPSVLEQTENIVADNDAGLAGQNILDTHFCCVVCCKGGRIDRGEVNSSRSRDKEYEKSVERKRMSVSDVGPRWEALRGVFCLSSLSIKQTS